MLRQYTDNREYWDAYNAFHHVCGPLGLRKILARYELFRKVKDIPGDILELGVARGVGLVQWCAMLEQFQPHSRSKVIGFDLFDTSFEGSEDIEIASAENLMRHFQPTFEHVDALIESLGLERVSVIKGDVTETLPAYLADKPGARFSIVNCDLDTYRPTLAALEAVWPHVVPGGLILLDEYAIEHWKESQAADEFLSNKGIQLQGNALSKTPSAWFRKPL